ncbi:hypothetical protein MATL_G00256770 [Megalops atlanticus]|uniref:Alkylated DNA repair protein AlkB homologue 8 N-terminal domain-containing protein n=1 Tax=Megalops atlanticus TaxID=7932 RepID=A0A9D3PA36_MEGAT|nr:hypothetical protein MATL_G00256770 [Megalops atlanticus]
MVVDFRKEKQHPQYASLKIYGTPVERVSSYKYLGVLISEDLSWSELISTVVKKARQRLYHLKRLRKFKISTALQGAFYSATIQSVVTGSITVWHGNSSSQDRKDLSRVICCAEHITRTALPDLQDICIRRCRFRAQLIIKDIHHPNHKLFQWLPSGKRLRSLMASTERFRRSFFPQAIQTINTTT